MEQNKKPFYKKWWFIALIVLSIIGALLPKEKEVRNYTSEAQSLIQNLRNPISEGQLRADYEKAAVLFNEMKAVKDTSDSFLLVQMELDALLAYQEQNIVSEVKKMQIKKQFSSWDGSHLNLTKYIKNKMNDPKSYEHIQTTYEVRDEKLIIYTEFRGKNAFNAVILNNAVAIADMEGNILEVQIGN